MTTRWTASALVLAATLQACRADAPAEDPPLPERAGAVPDTPSSLGRTSVGAPTEVRAEVDAPYVGPVPPWKPEARLARENERPGVVWEMNGLRYSFYRNNVRIDTLDREAAAAAPTTRIRMGAGSYHQIGDARYRFVDGRLVRDTVSVAREQEARRRAEAPLWRASRSWSGSGYHTTESFRVRAERWRIVLGARSARDGGWQKLNVYDQRGRRVTALVREGVGVDTVLLDRPGIYHLEIGAAKSRWRVSVDERTPPAEAVETP